MTAEGRDLQTALEEVRRKRRCTEEQAVQIARSFGGRRAVPRAWRSVPEGWLVESEDAFLADADTGARPRLGPPILVTHEGGLYEVRRTNQTPLADVAAWLDRVGLEPLEPDEGTSDVDAEAVEWLERFVEEELEVGAYDDDADLARFELVPLDEPAEVVQARSDRRFSPDDPGAPPHVQAHRHSIRHRREVLSSRAAGCFSCLEVFAPSAIDEWVDEEAGVGQTAICPRCGIDSIIGDASGYPLDADFLRKMRRHWFGDDGPESDI